MLLRWLVFISFAIEVCMSPKARTPMFQKTETVQEIRMAYGTNLSASFHNFIGRIEPKLPQNIFL